MVGCLATGRLLVQSPGPCLAKCPLSKTPPNPNLLLTSQLLVVDTTVSVQYDWVNVRQCGVFWIEALYKSKINPFTPVLMGCFEPLQVHFEIKASAAEGSRKDG